MPPCHQIESVERVRRSHRIVEQAVVALHAGDPGSGVKSLCFAAATHLALTLGPAEANAFFQMLAGVAGQVRPDQESAA